MDIVPVQILIPRTKISIMETTVFCHAQGLMLRVALRILTGKELVQMSQELITESAIIRMNVRKGCGAQNVTKSVQIAGQGNAN
jgi:hypothetical protein